MAENDTLPENPYQNCSIPIRLSREDRAAMWLHEWQGRNCEKVCGDRECRLPSVMKVEIYSGVGHGTAGRARLRILADSPRCLKLCPLATVPGNGTVFEPPPCQTPPDVG